MKIPLKPLIRYKYNGLKFLYDCPTAKGLGKGKPHLCHPLTPASRKAMIEAIVNGIAECYKDGVRSYQDVAKAALAALEKLAIE